MHLHVTAAVFLVAASSFAKAPPKPTPKQIESKQHYTDGMAHYNIEDYDGAIKEFQNAYLLAPDPVYLFNIGQAQRMKKQTDKAIDYYRRYLRETPDAPNHEEVEKIVAELEAERKKESGKAQLPPGMLHRFPPAMPVVEKETNTGYLSNVVSDGKLYTLVGVGVRKYYGFKIYGMALYLEDEPARRDLEKLAVRAGGKDLAHLTVDDMAQSFILLGDFGKIGQLKFVRGLSAKDVQKSYRESLATEVPKPTPAMKKDIERFVGLFSKDVVEGDDCIIRTLPTGEISVETAGKRNLGPTNPQLAQTLWNIWLGKRPISADLRSQLVNHIDAIAPR